jgi:type IV pilus assembly protein PilQ
LLSAFLLPALALAQEPDEGDVRTVVPPDQLVSFAPSTPFDQFVEFVNPIFKRVTGKTIVDPEDRTQAIGVDISRAQFLDAFELVLQANGLTYRETESAFIVQQAQTPPEDQETTARPGDEKALATLTSREVRINALFFQVNRSKARQLGLDWGFLFGGGGQGGGQGGGGGGGGGGQGDQGGQRTGLNILVQTEDIFENLDEFIIGPDQIALSTLTQLFRFLESNNAGETVANPSVTVQSGQQGRIQIGSDVPIQTRDFAGNTITEFFSTGVIVEVTPT